MKTYTIENNVTLPIYIHKTSNYSKALKKCTYKKIYFENRYYRTGDIYLVTKAIGRKYHQHILLAVFTIANRSMHTANKIRKYISAIDCDGTTVAITNSNCNISDPITVNTKDIIYIGNVYNSPEYMKYTTYMIVKGSYTL